MSLHVSQVGMAALRLELAQREEQLARTRAEAEQAFELSGDGWHDNPYLNRLQQEEAQLTKQVAGLQASIRDAVTVRIVEGRRPTRRVALGSVGLFEVVAPDGSAREQLVEIAPHGESDARFGRVAYDSPIGRQLVGLEVGDTVEVETPKGELGYTLLALHPTHPGALGGSEVAG